MIITSAFLEAVTSGSVRVLGKSLKDLEDMEADELFRFIMKGRAHNQIVGQFSW